MEEINTIVCQKCLHENDVHLTLCINCGAPCGDYATILPLDRIYAEGQGPKAEKKTFRTFDEIPFEERIKQYSLSDLFDIRDQVDRAAYPDRYQLIQKEIMLRNNGAD